MANLSSPRLTIAQHVARARLASRLWVFHMTHTNGNPDFCDEFRWIRDSHMKDAWRLKARAATRIALNHVPGEL